LMERAEGQPHLRRHAGLVLLDHLGTVAPGQELGILRDIGHQGVHLVGAVPDQDGLVNGFHSMGTACATDCIEAMQTSPDSPWPQKNKTPPPGSRTTRRPRTTISSRNASRPAWCSKDGRSSRCAKARYS